MYDEFQDVWAGVVAGGVEFHVAQDDLVHVQVGVDDGFPVPDGLGDVVTARIDDAAAAAAGRVVQFGLATAPLSTRSAGYMSLVKYWSTLKT